MERMSVWKGTSREETRFPQLEGSIEVDVTIVGGGITGMMAAMLLKEKGKRVAVLEAEQVGMGTTHQSTGNLYAMLSDQLSTIREKWDDDTMKMVVQSRQAAIDLIEDAINRYTINCGFKRCDWHYYATPAGSRQSPAINKEFDALRFAGLNPEYIESLPLPFKLDKGIKVGNQAQFHPLNFVRGLARSIASDECLILENTGIVDFNTGTVEVRTARGSVKSGKIIMATHTPKGINAVQAEMIAAQEFGLAARLKDGSYPQGIFWGHDESRHSIRSYHSGNQQYLIVIGEMHHTGHGENTQQYHDKLEQFARSSFNIDSIDYTWLGQHYRPADKLPYIGHSPGSSNLYIATGFSTGGLVYGAVSAMILSDEILGRTNEWDDLYKASRFDPIKGAKGIWKEQTDAVKHMVKDYLQGDEVKPRQDLLPGDGAILEIDGEQVAAYMDEQGQVTTLSPVCPHLKCRVHWSNAEKSWDCPCHGSRFDKKGKVLEGPALSPLERKPA